MIDMTEELVNWTELVLQYNLDWDQDEVSHKSLVKEFESYLIS